MSTRVGILTGGGDCPGLNAVIRAVVRRGIDEHNIAVSGFRNGWRGVLDGAAEPLTFESTRGILHRGGTVLGTSRTNPEAADRGVERVREALDIHRLSGLIVVGGEGTLSAATALWEVHRVPIIGVPKTIDNDLSGTQFTIGFSTALDIATEAVDRLHSTAESHNRVMLLEVMGRNAGWIATYAGLAGGADAILIPEHPFDIDRVARHLKRRHGMGRPFSIVVVAEGAVPVEGTVGLPDYDRDEFGRPVLGGLGNVLAPIIEERTGFATRVTTLGHVQRGGSPNAFDRVLGSTLGVAAVDAVARGEWGAMVGLQGNAVVPVPLREATATLKTVPPEVYRVAEVFFG
ncbi:MAG TPA: ATP-dependent 6-phosphofructokinase [Egibacteraceae bacterium]|jgi:ATP-dependent phosphofructokinase / diphosphate-dependent phosphofructokinase|nr:ATP-dependent 6-phosphofructokinase [Egibacteraceae bacterium]